MSESPPLSITAEDIDVDALIAEIKANVEQRRARAPD